MTLSKHKHAHTLIDESINACMLEIFIQFEFFYLFRQHQLDG